MNIVVLFGLLMHVIHGLYIEGETKTPTTVLDGRWIASHDCTYNAMVSDSVRMNYNAKSSFSKIGNVCFTMFEDTTSRSIFVHPTVQVMSGKQIQFEQDQIVRIASEPKSWGLDRIDQNELPLSKTGFKTEYTGKGVTIYILDTGINANHREFTGINANHTVFTNRVTKTAQFVHDLSETDGNGHGTHCAGTAAGTSYGVARNASIIGVKVLNAGGSGATSGVIAGIEWAVNDAANRPSVISMSLGAGKDTALDAAVKAASNAGLVVVVAAGNSNADACNYSPAGAGGKGSVITVAATENNDNRASYSNYGKCVDIFAPGSNITSAWIGSKHASNIISGTSMAAPHVAGVMAVLLEKRNGNKAEAINDLFSMFAIDKVNNPKGSPNRFLQLPSTDQEAPEPIFQYPMDQMCVGNKCTETFYTSTYCAICNDSLTITNIPMVIATNDLCSRTNTEKFKGKVVFVKRGNCEFYNKTINAQAAGAKAIVIYRTDAGDAFRPKYYGGGVPSKIQSYMISRADADRFLSMNSMTWSLTVYPIQYADSPTIKPTNMPTSPTTRNPTNTPTSPTTRNPTNTPISPTTGRPTTRKPTNSPTSPTTGRPTTRKPTKTPTIPTSRPTRKPTTSTPTRRPTTPTTNRPSTRPTTQKPTPPTTSMPTSPTSKRHTQRPTTKRPTTN